MGKDEIQFIQRGTYKDDRTPVPNDRRPAKAELDKDLFG